MTNPNPNPTVGPPRELSPSTPPGELPARLAALSGDALVLLAVAAWLDCDPIPVGLLSVPAGSPGPAALSALGAAGLVTSRPDGGFTLPEATRREMHALLGTEGRDLALRILQAHLGEPGSPGETARCLHLLPHLIRWTALTRPEDDTPEGATFLSRAVVLLLENRMGSAAVPLAERVARTAETHMGPDAPKTLSVQANLASVYDQVGEHRRGARLLEKVIASRTAQLGPEHPDVWDAYNNLGGIYLTLGEYEKSARIVEGLIAHRTKELGPADRRTLMARNNLAVITRRAGRRDDAVTLWEAVLPEFEAALGEDDTDTIAVRAALFQARKDRGGTGRTADLTEVEERIARFAGSSGEPTQEAVAALVERATALRDQGRYDEAVTGYREAIERGCAALGPGHPVMVCARYRMAHALQARGDAETALAEAEEALAFADRSLGRLHYETLMAAASVLSLLLRLERLQEYQDLLETRLADVIERLGFGHPLVRALAARRASLALNRPVRP
ncbi:tetratricopeptide repeat protein [Streptomyces sp. NBC_00047]|uniref:tetratricopeptide repeat protein n=1 Tax=Streptomyces sp. NBC_00047 TaxID=2975627 RepID=UPI002252D934|nr:tetratricopeptide repeat protein [Streptomyces sp. NBC_00047]MCX5610218.1 tetratricopeptide repeat protein [Streptomyces sp. NBC_00047]